MCSFFVTNHGINIKFCVYCHVLNPMSTSSENTIVLHIISNRFDTW